MKACVLSLFVAAAGAFGGVDAFVPASNVPRAFVGSQQQVVVLPSSSSTSLSMAKYNTMEEILAKFPDDKPILINFYDAATEDDIKADIQRAKQLLANRCTVVSIRQQDYPEIAKLWDAAEKSPSFILFNDGKPVVRFYEETHYLEITAKVGQYCRPEGEEHKAHK